MFGFLFIKTGIFLFIIMRIMLFLWLLLDRKMKLVRYYVSSSGRMSHLSTVVSLSVHITWCILQVKTGKSSLEQISYVYGNQVSPSKPLHWEVASSLKLIHFWLVLIDAGAGYYFQAVVVSIDPRRIYVNDPSETPFRTIQVSKPGMLPFSSRKVNLL
jgi:hypothetical protein